MEPQFTQLARRGYLIICCCLNGETACLGYHTAFFPDREIFSPLSLSLSGRDIWAREKTPRNSTLLFYVSFGRGFDRRRRHSWKDIRGERSSVYLQVISRAEEEEAVVERQVPFEIYSGKCTGEGGGGCANPLALGRENSGSCSWGRLTKTVFKYRQFRINVDEISKSSWCSFGRNMQFDFYAFWPAIKFYCKKLPRNWAFFFRKGALLFLAAEVSTIRCSRFESRKNLVGGSFSLRVGGGAGTMASLNCILAGAPLSHCLILFRFCIE